MIAATDDLADVYEPDAAEIARGCLEILAGKPADDGAAALATDRRRRELETLTSPRTREERPEMATATADPPKAGKLSPFQADLLDRLIRETPGDIPGVTARFEAESGRPISQPSAYARRAKLGLVQPRGRKAGLPLAAPGRGPRIVPYGRPEPEAASPDQAPEPRPEAPTPPPRPAPAPDALAGIRADLAAAAAVLDALAGVPRDRARRALSLILGSLDDQAIPTPTETRP